MSRELNFTSTEELTNLRLEQRVSFKGRVMEGEMLLEVVKGGVRVMESEALLKVAKMRCEIVQQVVSGVTHPS